LGYPQALGRAAKASFFGDDEERADLLQHRSGSQSIRPKRRDAKSASR
jgi:hypothetical protein